MKYCFLFILILCPLYSTAQYRDFLEGDLMQADSVIFEVSYALNKTMYLTNTANQLDDEWISWADGQPIGKDNYNALLLGTIDKSSVRQAIRNTFTEWDYSLLAAGKDRIDVYLTLSSEGKILELSLFVNLSPRTLNLTPQQYADLETNLKKYVSTTVTPDMAKLNFWRSFLVLDFSRLDIRYKNPDAEMLPDSLQIIQ